jgi:hypothetical protein
MAYFFPVILFITFFFYFPVSGNAQLLNGPGPSLLPAPDFRVWSPDGSGGWNINYGSKSTGGTVSGNAQVLSGGTQLRHHNLWDIPSSNGKSYRVPLSHTSNVDIAKVGSRLGSLARKLSPVGMAIGTAAYICSETNICDEAGKWVIPADPQYSDYPSSYPSSDGRWSPGSSSGLTYPTPAAACSDSGRPYSNPALYEQKSPVFVNNNNYSCEVKRISDNATLFNGSTVRTANVCPTGYTLNDGTCVFGGNTENVEPDQAQWDAAEAVLNQPASTEHIVNNGGTVPADSSSPPSLDGAPLSQPIGTTTTTLYDANNNATGTQTKETTLTITDGATSDAPNQITYNETTITNNYDLSNNLIDRTVVDTSAPPPAPPEIGDIEIEFDSVPENELEEYETPDMDDWTSWGSGSCPPPISINTNHWNGVLDTQPMCDFAEGINPFVLLFAALISAYIVAGIRTSGH